MAGVIKDMESLLKTSGILGILTKLFDSAGKTLDIFVENAGDKAQTKSKEREKLEEEKLALLYDILMHPDDEVREFLTTNMSQRQDRKNGYLHGDEDIFTVVFTRFKKAFSKTEEGKKKYHDILRKYAEIGIKSLKVERAADPENQNPRPKAFDAQIEIAFPDYKKQRALRAATKTDQVAGQVVGQANKLLAESGFVANKKSTPFNTGSVALNELLGMIRAVLDTGNRWIYWFIFGSVAWFFFTPFIAMMGSKELLLGFGFVICSLGLVGAAFGIQRPIEIGILAKGLDKLRKGALSVIAIELAFTLVFAALAPMKPVEIIAFTLLFMMLIISMAAEQKFLQKLATIALVVIILISGNRVYGVVVSDTVSGWLKNIAPTSLSTRDVVVEYNGSDVVQIVASDEWSPWYELPKHRRFVFEGSLSTEIQFSGNAPFTIGREEISLPSNLSNRVRVRGGWTKFEFL